MVFHKKVKFPLDFRRRLCYTNQVLKSGCGAVGSALPWGGRGRKFKSCHSDHNRGCPNGTSPIIFCVAGYAEIAEKAKAFSKRACARQVSILITQTSRSGMNRAFIPLLLFLQRKNMKLCPKTAPAPMAQRGGAGFPKARVRALGVPGRGRKFKSCRAGQVSCGVVSDGLPRLAFYVIIFCAI